MSLYVDKALRKAQRHIRENDLVKAEELYKQVLSKFPKNHKAIQAYKKLKVGITSKGQLGIGPSQQHIQELMSLYDHGRYEEVLAKVKPLINLFPKASVLFTAQGVSNAALQKYEAAIESYKQAIRIDPNSADAHYNLGNALKQAGNLKQAIESYKASLAINPNDAEVLLNCGNAFKSYGDFDQAIEVYIKALRIDPNFTTAQTNMDTAVKEKAEIDKQISAYATMSNLEINSAEILSFTGNLLKASGYLDAAIDCYEQAIKVNPDYANAYLCMGITFKNKDDLDSAIDSYKQALDIDPDYTEALSNMGNALKNKGDLGAAIDSYKKALDIDPDYAEAHLNLGFALLNSGRLREGLEEYEWRWKTPESFSQERHFSQPLWDGRTNLKGKKILIWGEQGPGDLVLWSFCIRYLAAKAEHCILECHEKLVPLFARSFPNVEVKGEFRSLDNERADFDFHLPMGSLFRHFVSEVSQNNKPDAFLIPDPVRVKFWKERLQSLGEGPFVGMSWKSPQISPTRQPNYTQISDWAAVLTLPNVTFINLQSKDFVDDLTKIQTELGVTVHNFDDLDHYDNLDDVAALAAALDIVVSVSTAVAMIAAGVGTSTKFVAWRQSEWNNILYTPVGPSVDVYERNTLEPWDNVFQSIAKEITKFQVA